MDKPELDPEILGEFPWPRSSDRLRRQAFHNLYISSQRRCRERLQGSKGPDRARTRPRERAGEGHAGYFLGANDPYKALKTTLKAEIDLDAWATLNCDTSRPFPRPASGRIAVKVINHLGDEAMKVFRV